MATTEASASLPASTTEPSLASPSVVASSPASASTTSVSVSSTPLSWLDALGPLSLPPQAGTASKSAKIQAHGPRFGRLLEENDTALQE
jgi:hypothetical protein